MTDHVRTEAERVADAVREQIIARTRLPGSRLIERTIAAELGVSRLPVRDALRVLEREGLVARVGRSIAVRELELRDLGELAEVCEAFDAVAARLAAERRSDAHLERIRATFAEMSRAIGDDDTGATARSVLAYRGAIADASRNPFLVEISTVLRGREAGAVLTPQVIAEHGEAVVRAIEEGDAAAVDQGVRAQYAAARHAMRREVLEDLEAKLTATRAAGGR
ncbi:GntR family transcriptional regulator [Agromyces mediolanus]|uniref:GntR family transcriptional regulator n=1 Tax=Agromyces mediolanus TaxID=41986 RepID=UPI00203D9231|nr:GntR family transcriptional regulator [Agromyces mediolanus]MCM3656225.1 GntR family transcriptional regulator [Agromyces mediolanus]